MRARVEFLVGNRVTVADFVMAYTLDWGNEEELLSRFPRLGAYIQRMYAWPNAPMRLSEALATIGA